MGTRLPPSITETSMHMRHVMLRIPRTCGMLLAACAIAWAPLRAVAADEAPVYAKQSPEVKKAEQEMMTMGARKHFAREAEKAKAKAKAMAKRSKALKRGQRVTRAPLDEDVAAGG